MELFLLIAIPATLLAVFFVVRPIFRSAATRTQNNDQLRISIYRENLQELESEFSSGQVDPDQVDNVRKELELSLLREAGNSNATNTSAEHPDRHPLIMSMIVGSILVGLTMTLYYLLGNPQLIALEKLWDISSTQTSGNNPSNDQMIILMEEHLRRNPDDANHLFLLANMYVSKSDYQKAIATFERLYQLSGDNTQVLLTYADTLVRVNNGSFAGLATELIHRALSVDPENYTALLFAGLAAEETGNYRDANDYYSKLLPVLQDQPEMSQTINMLIANNNVRMQQDGTAADVTDQSTDGASVSAKSIRLAVSVSPDLADQFEPDNTLFIYAQELQGSPMPLAVFRTRADDLPMEVTLDDTLAMMPTRKLSNFDVVRIQARISKTGSAEPASGDILGVLEEVSVAEQNIINLVINQVIP